MKKIITILILSLMMLPVAACGNSEPSAGSAGTGTAVDNAGPQANKQPEDQPIIDDPADSLKREQIIGLSSDEVSAKYGEPEAVTDANHFLIMRYDFPAEGYQYPEKVISIDVKGLTDSKMLAQLVVDYGEDKTADSYSIFYMTGSEVMQYRVTKDGAEEYPAGAD
ncbi:hypothetical protein [Cohnella kolymensis]|uniref:hypothetical protein n=1 Tax=Cohnella kolymensis TaxID=1590652 RepID=UPI000698FC4F|nr:hypothetical protein [Cohnella kolymensis]